MPPFTRQTGRESLKELDLLENKHIPERYFLASPRQRLALLQGLMDTDGSCDKAGHVSIALSHERLASDVHRLILSLGHKCKIRSRVSRFYGRIVNTEYRMSWTAPEPVFRLSRKLERQKIATKGPSRTRYIESVVPVGSVPVRCIRVSGPSHLFLIGKECVATHNSLKTLEAPLLAKVLDRQETWGPVWSDAMRFALQIMGKGDHEPEPNWADTTPRSDLEQTVIATSKQALGIPEEILWKELGYSQEQIDAIKKIIAQGQPPPLPASTNPVDKLPVGVKDNVQTMPEGKPS